MSDERVRLFVALELPEHVREGLVRWRRESVGALDGMRHLDPAGLHVTLCFLGWQGVIALEPISLACETVRDAAAPGLGLGEGLWLPPRRPRVLAVALEDPHGRVTAVQARLAEALEAGGWYRPESRPFLAHVTVARVRAGARVRPRKLPSPPQLRFDGTAVTLYRSRLGSQGARYEPLRTISLATGSSRS